MLGCGRDIRQHSEADADASDHAVALETDRNKNLSRPCPLALQGAIVPTQKR